MKKLNIVIICFVAALALGGCTKDYLETSPTESIDDQAMFSSVTSTYAALNGLHRATYKYYGAHSRFGQKSIDLVLDAMGDDCFSITTTYGGHVLPDYQWLRHRDVDDLNRVNHFWDYYYDLINNANLILKNVDNVPTVGDAEINQIISIKAQALVYRAYSHYNLVQLYGSRYVIGAANTQLGVPYYEAPTNVGQARNTVDEVYAKVKADLDQAITLFGQSTTPRVNVSHININVAKAIYARVALTTGDWTKASTMAKEARVGFNLVDDYTYGWSKVASEWIWGALLNDEQSTSYASFFSHIDPDFGGYASLGQYRLGSTAILSAMNDTDQRKMCFDDFQAGKVTVKNVGYKFTGEGSWTNDYLYIKSGEMFMIEAEAEAMLGHDTEAQNVLFTLVSKRDPEYVKTTKTGTDLIEEIKIQRRCEMWGDGQRFFDLKRYNKGMDRHNQGHNETLFLASGQIPAGDIKWEFVIPVQEMNSNKLMVQNPL